MIDLHSHTLFSDGELLPEELARRCEEAGYRALAFTDHAGPSNIEMVVEGLIKAAEAIGPCYDMRIIPGVELTHCPPAIIAETAERARNLGARLVIVHGETLAEPVKPGTNRAAIEAGVDIVAHPGLITLDEAKLAAGRGVCLEISARCGHNATNGHVAAVAKSAGATLVFGTDTHSPGNICPLERAVKLARGAGLGESEAKAMIEGAWRFFE
jgi:histidinol phosphatase-like PHP family hydrolase